MDAFFVSVEEIFDPSLKGKAVVVGGPADARGVVSAASYEARKFGVHSAMPLRTAYQKCPHAIFLEGNRERYVEYSRKVENELRAFTPLVNMASIDEAYLDITGTERLHGPPLAAGFVPDILFVPNFNRLNFAPVAFGYLSDKVSIIGWVSG